MPLQGKTRGEKLLLQFLRPAGRQSARQKRANVRWPDIEQICQGFGVVAMAGQAWLHVIQITRQYTFNEVRWDGFLRNSTKITLCL